VFASTDVTHDGEGSDRTTLDLAAGQDALIAAVAKVNAKTVVVVTSAIVRDGQENRPP
jgi:beta-glucosidase